MVEQQSAYSVLQTLAHKSLASAHQLPAQVDIAPQWSGVGFSLMGIHFVVSMGQLAEMLEIPQFTRLPGVHSWVKGVANVRGRLLPIFDLSEFFGGVLTGNKKQQRVLVLDTETIYTGLWVDAVYGMQHFPIDTKFDSLPDDFPDVLKPFVSEGYQAEDRPWFVFNPLLLTEDSRFLDAALL